MIDPVRSTARLMLRSSLEAGTDARLHIDGMSMRPTLRAGDIVVVRSLPVDQLRVGDILLIQREDDMVTHRLVSIQPDGWYTKGDSSSILDSPASEESILGRVEAIERSGSSWSTRTRSWIAFSHCIAWLAWQEAREYQWVRRLAIPRGDGKKWLAHLVTFPFRLPMWLLAAFRR